MKGEITVILIACVDDNYGLLFNGRRVSKDETVIKKLLETIGNNKLWMSEYTSSLFQEEESKNRKEKEERKGKRRGGEERQG